MIELALSAQAAVWLIMLGVFFASRQASIFHPVSIYLGFHGLVFVARPLLVHLANYDSIWRYMLFQPTDEDFIRTLCVSSVAMVVFVAMSVSAGRTKISFVSSSPVEVSPIERRALLWLTLSLLPILAWSIYTTREGIPGERAENGIFIMTKSSGYLTDAQNMLGPLLSAWLLATRFHRFNSIPLLVYIGYRSWFGWARWTILLFCLTLVLAYCWYHRKKWIPLWSILLAIPVLLLFNTLGHNRDILRNYLKGEEAKGVEQRPGLSAAEKRKLRFDTQDFANFDYLCFVVAIFSRNPDAYTYGSQYLQLVTEPIPRLLWKGKPAGGLVQGKVDFRNYGNFLGLTVSMPGDGWVSGGWIGLVIELSLFGAITGWCHSWFWRNSDQPIPALFYLSGLAMLPQWYRDGGISIFKFLLWSWLPLILWQAIIWLMGERKVPAYSVVLPRGARVRVITQAKSSSGEQTSPSLS